MTSPRILVAGVGNLLLSDDGWGVTAAARLSARPLPANVRVADFGIRSLHLAYELADGFDVLIFLDTMRVGAAAGTVTVLEVDVADSGLDEVAPDPHVMHPAAVLAQLRAIGGNVDRVFVVGCEPLSVAEGIGLSDPVIEAVDVAVASTLALLDQLTAPAEEVPA